MCKNKVEQSSGWNESILRWCSNEAKKQGLKEEDYWGGFVIDEMKIQVSILLTLCFLLNIITNFIMVVNLN